MEVLKKFNFKTLLNYTVFAIAMGYLEAAVVVYLRLLYYPEGFQFPLKIIPTDVAIVELGRELSTIVMLWFAARTFNGRFRERFIIFIFMFGVWDLFYYFWLKVLLNWPASWLEWDILFLIPAPWIGPWLAPALVSIGFIVVTILLWLRPEKFDGPAFSKKVWLIEIICALLILISFFWETANVVRGGLPEYYPWWLFFAAYALGFGTFLRAYLKS
ncbi:hypothetical protein ACX8XN_12690 [Calditrichota bacterium GD2]